VLDRSLRHEDRPEHVDIENSVELFFGDSLYWSKLVNARVIDQDIETARSSLSLLQ